MLRSNQSRWELIPGRLVNLIKIGVEHKKDREKENGVILRESKVCLREEGFHLGKTEKADFIFEKVNIIFKKMEFISEKAEFFSKEMELILERAEFVSIRLRSSWRRQSSP
jgi:hypothetical protein